MLARFQSRMYPIDLLNSVLEKLNSISRDMTLIRKRDLLLSYLRIHDPILLSNLNVPHFNPSVPRKSIFVTIPFYN